MSLRPVQSNYTSKGHEQANDHSYVWHILLLPATYICHKNIVVQQYYFYTVGSVAQQRTQNRL